MSKLNTVGMDTTTGQFKIATSSDQMTSTGGTDTSGVQTSGALQTTTLTSGVAKQIVTTRDFNVWIPITYNPTAILTATCQVELSADNVTYSVVATETRPALATLAGLIDSVSVPMRAGYWIRVTVTNASIGTVSYW